MIQSAGMLFAETDNVANTVIEVAKEELPTKCFKMKIAILKSIIFKWLETWVKE